MLLKNNAARLITINANSSVSEKAGAKRYKILPGNNPAVEVPDKLCKSKFVQSLINKGALVQQVVTTPEVDMTEEIDDELSGKTKAELLEMAVGLGLDAKSAMSKSDIIALINGE